MPKSGLGVELGCPAFVSSKVGSHLWAHMLSVCCEENVRG